MVSRVVVMVEGRTEEEFVRGTLSNYLNYKNISLTAIPINRTEKGSGGAVTYGRIKREIQQEVYKVSAALVTTMIDFYGFPKDFPNYQKYFRNLTVLSEAFKQDIGHPKFLPYLSCHEFEAILFTDPYKIVKAFPDLTAEEVETKVGKLLEAKSAYKSPEEIDLENNPSKILKSLLEGYRKKLHGYYIADEIGLERIRAECPHFNDWLVKLENLGS